MQLASGKKLCTMSERLGACIRAGMGGLAYNSPPRQTEHHSVPPAGPKGRRPEQQGERARLGGERQGKLKPSQEDPQKSHPINRIIAIINHFMELTVRSKSPGADDATIFSLAKKLGLPRQTEIPRDSLPLLKERLLRRLYSVLASENSVALQKPSTHSFKCHVALGNNGELVRGLMLSRWWWTASDPCDAAFLWTPWKNSSFVKTLPTERDETAISKLCNHLEGETSLGDKKSLFRNMQKYYELTGRDVFGIMPLTFHISAGVQDPYFIRFREAYVSVETAEEEENLWIAKPGENTNRGTGIVVSGDVDEIADYVCDQTHSSIIQKYIERPLLFNGRKFDIRCYGLITSVNGLIKGYFYREGYLRTSSKKFTLKSLKRSVHLTNEAVQIRYDNFGKFEAGNKVSFSEFQTYLQSQPESIDFSHDILPRIKVRSREGTIALS